MFFKKDLEIKKIYKPHDITLKAAQSVRMQNLDCLLLDVACTLK